VRSLTTPRLAALAFLALSLPAGAQQSEPLPVSVSVAPRVTVAGRTVTISGESVGTGQRSSVTIAVRGPAAARGAGAPKTVALDGASHYSYAFTDTRTAGTYTVQVTGPDGAGRADASFKVNDAASAASDVQSVVAAGDAAVRIATALRAQIDGIPPSPAKDEVLRKAGELDAKLQEFRRASPPGSEAIRTVVDVARQVTLDDKRDAEFHALLDALDKSREQVARTPAQEQSLRRQVATCDNLEVVVEGFKYVSFLLNLAAGSVSGIAGNFKGDLAGYLGGKGADAAGAQDVANYGSSAASKNTAALVMALRDTGNKIPTLSTAAGNAAGNASDLAGFVASHTMSNYCEIFTGPMTAHMKAQFFHENVKWWEYEFDLLGKVTVHYPKGATGSRIPVKGRLEGYAYGFKVWENALTVLYPNLMSSAVQKKIVIPPPELGKAGAKVGAEYIEGSVVGAAGLNAFFFEVTGTADKDRLTLQVGAARSDIDAKARVVALSLSPLSLSIAFNAYSLPYKPAHFIFERAADSYVIPIATVGKVIRGKKRFENERGGAEAKGQYRVDIEVCNPGC
jgi:hypothetical protein